MMDHPVLFSAPMVLALLDGRKTQTRRILTARNTLPNGAPWRDLGASWDACDWQNAWVDDGPSPAGNTGPYLKVRWPYGAICKPPTDETLVARIYPRVQRGDRLWAREAWRAWSEFDNLPPRDIPPNSGVQYEASNGGFPWDSRYRHSQFMPRWASRLTLIVTDIRIQRLQDISEDDAEAEGATSRPGMWEKPDWSMDWTEIGRHSRFRGGALEQHDIALGRADWAFASYWNEINGEGAWESNPWVLAITFTVHQSNIDAMGHAA